MDGQRKMGEEQEGEELQVDRKQIERFMDSSNFTSFATSFRSRFGCRATTWIYGGNTFVENKCATN